MAETNRADARKSRRLNERSKRTVQTNRTTPTRERPSAADARLSDPKDSERPESTETNGTPEWVGLLALLVGALSFAALHTEAVGLAGKAMAGFMRYMLGAGADGIAILSVAAAVVSLHPSWRPTSGRRIGAFLTFFAVGLILLSMGRAGGVEPPLPRTLGHPYWGALRLHLAQVVPEALSGVGGGWVGEVMWALLGTLLGRVGTLLLLLALLIGAISAGFNTPVQRLLLAPFRATAWVIRRVAAVGVERVDIGVGGRSPGATGGRGAAVPAAAGGSEAIASDGRRRRRKHGRSGRFGDAESENSGNRAISAADAATSGVFADAGRSQEVGVSRRSVAGADSSEEFSVQQPMLPGVASRDLPSARLFTRPSAPRRTGRTHDHADQSEALVEALDSFGIHARVVKVSGGPVVTRYELQPPPGIKVSRIVSLADDIALALAAAGVRIEAPVPGKSVVGIEVPNKETRTVYFRDVVEADEFQRSSAELPMALGQDISGNSVVGDLTKHIHLLIAGATGSGKSVCLASIICSLLLRAGPQELKLLMVDPKRVELAVYDGLPHLVAPVVTDPKKAASALRWVVREMEERYRLFAAAGVRNIAGYNAWVTKELKKRRVDPEKTGFMAAALEVAASADGNERRSKERGGGHGAAPGAGASGEAPGSTADGADEPLPSAIPYMVVIVDELADLMLVAASDVEDSIARLAQMARAAGIHMILATQRPSVDVVTGLIKANIPSRIAFAVSSHVDSRTVLDMGGAERLLGRGDMLYYPTGEAKPTRVQGALLFDNDIEELVKYWKSQGDPTYADSLLKVERSDSQAEDMEDELLQQAIELVLDTGQASVSMLQRRFRIGYTRAARLIDMMERRSIVGPYQGSKPREILVSDEEAEALRTAGP